MTKNLKAGFSLVELMVVVAIIGILATVALPNFTKFQAKAKQSSAKTELAGIFTAEKAFFIEYNQFYGALPVVGYVPEGENSCTGAGAAGANGGTRANRIYSVGFSASTATIPTSITTDPCGAAAGANISFFGNGANHASAAAPAWAAGSAPTAGAGVLVASQTTTFVAAAEGWIRGPVTDQWTIDQNRDLRNTRPGL